MALQLIGFDGTAEPDAYRGVHTAELGINCESVKAKYSPEVKEKLAGITGESRAFAVSALASCALTISGEILKASVGILVAVFNTAFAPASTHLAYYGRTGGFYLDSADIEEDRSNWWKGTWELSSNPLIA